MAAAACASYSGAMANWNLAQFIGRNIERLRERREMTQDDLAASLGRKQPTISEWENGNTLPRLPELINDLERADIDPRELFLPEPEWYQAGLIGAEQPIRTPADPDIASTVRAMEDLPRDIRHLAAELIGRVCQSIPREHDAEAGELMRILATFDPDARRGILDAVRSMIQITQRGGKR